MKIRKYNIDLVQEKTDNENHQVQISVRKIHVTLLQVEG